MSVVDDFLHAETDSRVSRIAHVLAKAEARAREAGLPFRGVLTPSEAHQLHQAGAATLVDTRTHAERDWVGRVNDSLHIEWYSYPSREVNAQFVAALRHAVNIHQPVMFLCRSGIRSAKAAALATQHGFEHAYDILHGFEGEPNAAGQRNQINGWRAEALPWTQ